MTFEEFKKITYHTYKAIRIPGSSTTIDKSLLFTKGKYDSSKADKLLMQVYEEENYKDR